MRRYRALAQFGLPVVAVGHGDLGEDDLGGAVEDVVLVGDVVVERHRLDTQLLPEPAHRQRLDALRVSQSDCCLQHSVAAERHARFDMLIGLCH